MIDLKTALPPIDATSLKTSDVTSLILTIKVAVSPGFVSS